MLQLKKSDKTTVDHPNLAKHDYSLVLVPEASEAGLKPPVRAICAAQVSCSSTHRVLGKPKVLAHSAVEPNGAMNKFRTKPTESWFLFPTNLLGHYSSFRGPFRILPRHMCFIVCFRKPSAAHGLQDLLPQVSAQKGKSFQVR